MKHHKKEDNFLYVYYLVALVCGIFVGVIIEDGFVWVIACGILGLLTAAFYVNVLVKDRRDA